MQFNGVIPLNSSHQLFSLHDFQYGPFKIPRLYATIAIATDNPTCLKAFEANWLLKSTSKITLRISSLWQPISRRCKAWGIVVWTTSPIKIARGRHMVGGFLWRTGPSGRDAVRIYVCGSSRTQDTVWPISLPRPSMWVTDATAERSCRMLRGWAKVFNDAVVSPPALYLFCERAERPWPHHSMT